LSQNVFIAADPTNSANNKKEKRGFLREAPFAFIALGKPSADLSCILNFFIKLSLPLNGVVIY